jgi:hypothetical protein
MSNMFDSRLRIVAAAAGALAVATAAPSLLAQTAPKPATVEPVTRKAPGPVAQATPPKAPAAPAAAPAKAATPAAPAPTHEISVKILKVQALDKVDELSDADFFARVTIAGKVQPDTPVGKGATITPEWVVKGAVAAGKVPVRLELFDKDLTKNEAIDINRVGNKRAQDFVVDTSTCTISGFAGAPKCGESIVRAGEEPKKAAITFTVDAKPLAK